MPAQVLPSTPGPLQCWGEALPGHPMPSLGKEVAELNFQWFWTGFA